MENCNAKARQKDWKKPIRNRTIQMFNFWKNERFSVFPKNSQEKKNGDSSGYS